MMPLHCASTPDATLALLTADTRWDAATLARHVATRAADLSRQGVRAQQVVIVPAGGVDTIVMARALAALEAVLLPIVATASAAQLGAYRDATAAEWYWQPATRQLQPSGVAVPAPALTSAWDADPLAVIVGTSGSSGAPKLALFRRSAVTAASAASSARLDLRPGDRWLCCLPLQHVGGLAISDRCAHAAATLVLLARFEVATVAAWLHTAAITHVSLVPLMLARLLAHGQPPPPSLRVALIGGQALEPALAQAALAAGWPLHLSYGMTETFALLASRPLTSAALTTTCVGWPLPSVTCQCGAGATVAAAQPLRIRGASVMAGYATPARQPGIGLDAAGWMTTADLVGQTADGQLHVYGRMDDCLIIAGVNVSPRAIEQQVLAVPGVMQCVVLGLPAADWGGEFIAFYRGTISPDELTQWSRTTLPTEQRPRRFIQLAELPLLPSGKWDRLALYSLAQRERTG